MSGIECAFIGVLSRDAEQRTSKNGNPFLLLNARAGDGDNAQWIGVLCFDANAVENADRLLKGARIYVEGRLELKEWQSSDGSTKQSLNCVSWHCRLAGIGRNKPKRETSETASVAAGRTYRSPRSAPAGRLPGNGDFNDDIGF